jgi:CHAT domain-containing protein
MLRAGGFDILHFAGHGMADSADIANAKILLEGRRGHGTYVHTYLSATTVEQQARLTAPNGDKPLVVLNACQVGRAGTQMSSLGGFAHAFLNRGAGAFISSMWSVGDEPASTFVTTLYQELLKEESISEAVVRARAKAREAGDGTWLAYAVYAHPQARLRTKPGPAACGFPHGSRSSRRGTAT